MGAISPTEVRIMAETKKCRRCPEEYEPQYYEVLGIKILKGNGFCPGCAVIVYEEEVARDKATQEKGINDRRLFCLNSSGIPPKFRWERFKTFDKGWQDKALTLCQKYAEEFPVEKWSIGYPSLYLWSQDSWGVGKTHLSCAIAHRIFERWTGKNRGCPRICFVSEPELFRQIQATYSFTREDQLTRESEDDIMHRLTWCDLLILDDVGKERRPDPRFVQRTLFGLIDERYKLDLPIVLTANVNADGLRRHLEDASFDRFFEMIGGKSVSMDGQSYRRKR